MSFTNMPMIFEVSRCLFSTKPVSMGRQGVLNRWPSPIRALYSAIRAFLNSGPRSLNTSDGIVPLRIIQHANIRRASIAFSFVPCSSKVPWHKQQMYVIVYLLPDLSAGLLGPSRSTMTSSQQSTSVGIRGTVSCFCGTFLNLMHVRHLSHHWRTSSFIVGHQT